MFQNSGDTFRRRLEIAAPVSISGAGALPPLVHVVGRRSIEP